MKKVHIASVIILFTLTAAFTPIFRSKDCAGEEGTPGQHYYTFDPDSTVTLVTSRPLPTSARFAPHALHLYVGHPRTGVSAYLNSYATKDMDQALSLLNAHVIDGPAYAAGFRPLLPDDMQITASKATDEGVVTVHLPTGFPVNEAWRIAGLAMTLGQSPGTKSVRFLRNGQALRGQCYQANLATPITPATLQLPTARVDDYNGFPATGVHTVTHTPFLGTLSPDERYLAIGSECYDRQQQRWIQFQCWNKEADLSYIHGMQWLPGKPHTLLVQASYTEQGRDGFCLVTPEEGGDVQAFISLSDVLEWQLLPDGSGVLFLHTAATKPGDGAGWSELSELIVYTFADKKLRHLFLAPWVGGDMAPARGLFVPRDVTRTQGAVSYNAGYDPLIRFTVNMANGKNVTSQAAPSSLKMARVWQGRESSAHFHRKPMRAATVDFSAMPLPGLPMATG